MLIKSFIQTGFIPLSGALNLQAAKAKLSEGSYGVVLEGEKPVAIATAQRLGQIRSPASTSLLLAAAELPRIMLVRLEIPTHVQGPVIAAPTVVIAMPRVEAGLFAKAQGMSAVDPATRHGLLLDASGRAGVLPFKDIVEYLHQRRKMSAYRPTFTMLAISGLIGEPYSSNTLPGRTDTAKITVICEECKYPNELAVVPECNEIPIRCQNPVPPIHNLKIPGC